jgi:hypothetical protein
MKRKRSGKSEEHQDYTPEARTREFLRFMSYPNLAHAKRMGSGERSGDGCYGVAWRAATNYLEQGDVIADCLRSQGQELRNDRTPWTAMQKWLLRRWKESVYEPGTTDEREGRLSNENIAVLIGKTEHAVEYEYDRHWGGFGMVPNPFHKELA